MPILNLRIDQGTTFKTDLTINQDETTPLDLTGYTFRSEIRKHYRSTTITETLTIIIKNGVSRITVDDGGSGYTSAPAVVITPSGGDTPSPVATATAQVVSGVVTSVTVDLAGSGYDNVPTIGFSGGGGSSAAGTAITEAQDGKIQMSLTDAQTTAIKNGRYVYDVESIAPNTDVDRVLEGRVTVTPEVTR